MSKKRLIFTLLYKDGNYMLSRNFRLQKVGNLDWLKRYYNFQNIAFSIDELVVLNVNDIDKRDMEEFAENLKILSKSCFIPIAVGGGIKSIEDANLLLHSGADKIILNTAFCNNHDLIKELITIFGKQNIVASIDYKVEDNDLNVYIKNGKEKVDISLQKYIKNVCTLGAGEIYLNSIDKDGTGQGYFLDIVEKVASDINISLICAGGAGKYEHFLEAIEKDYIDAVATANLFNFLGNGLENSRYLLIDRGINIPTWHKDLENNLKNCIKEE